MFAAAKSSALPGKLFALSISDFSGIIDWAIFTQLLNTYTIDIPQRFGRCR